MRLKARLALLTGGLAVAAAALYRALRHVPSPWPEAEPAPDPHAEELRRKLDESRTVVAEREEFESAETPVDRAEPVSSDVQARRRRVHEEGQEAVERMRGRSKSL